LVDQSGVVPRRLDPVGPRPAPRSEVGHPVMGHGLPVVDEDDAVGQRFQIAQRVAGDHDGPSGIGQINMLGYVLRNRKVWAHTIGYSAYGYSFYLFLTWLPGYMVQTLHMTILKSAAFTIIPWMCASLADLLIGGFVVDYFIARGVDESKARKISIIGGMIAGLAVFGISFTQDPF
jgi:sugar phosphate permease